MNYTSKVLLTSLFLFISCKKNIQGLDSLVEYPLIMANTRDTFERSDWYTGKYSIISANLTDDVLTLHVEMNDAIDSTISLVCWNYWLESYPVQATSLLSFKENDKSEQRKRIRILRFGLIPMKESYLISYSGWGSGSNDRIIINFIDPLYPRTDKISVEYQL